MSETDGLLQNNNNNIDIENGDSLINVNELAKLDSLAASHYRQGKFLEASNLLKYVIIIFILLITSNP